MKIHQSSIKDSRAIFFPAYRCVVDRISESKLLHKCSRALQNRRISLTITLKNPEKTSQNSIQSEAPKPMFFSRVVMVKSRVRHGFDTGLKKPGFFWKPGVFQEKSRVDTGKPRVRHGFDTGYRRFESPTRLFPKKIFKDGEFPR